MCSSDLSDLGIEAQALRMRADELRRDGATAIFMAVDGQPAGYLKSSGIAHATKSKIELGVAGKDGWFDDIKVWNAEPAKP
mgnify:CR=1 FL=1